MSALWRRVSLTLALLLVLRREAGLRGRRAASLQLTALVLVAIVLPITHFAS